MQKQRAASGRSAQGKPPSGRLVRWLVAGSSIYLVGLAGWFALSRLAGDRWWWLFVLNSGALYLFAPLPVVTAIAVVVRRRVLLVGALLACMLWLALYGELFVPRMTARDAANPTLTVMTYNMLVHNPYPESVVRSIRTANADVVLLQELNHRTALTLHRELTETYPYQIFDPQADSSGMAALSRYPLRQVAQDLPGAWMGRPQVLTMNFDGTEIVLVNVHARSTSFGEPGNLRINPAEIAWTINQREQQMRLLVALAATYEQPLIVAGDLNTTDQSRAYAILADHLTDAWREAGQGFGHTFAGETQVEQMHSLERNSRFQFWWIRIDYLFCSLHWQVAAARNVPQEGTSDHRPVVATFRLRSPE